MSMTIVLFDRNVILALLSLLVSLVLLWGYLRSVKRSMLLAGASADQPLPSAENASPVTAAPPAAPLRIGPFSAQTYEASESVWRGPRRTVAIQIAAGLTYAAGVTLAWLWLIAKVANWHEFAWQGFVVFTLFFAWPLVVVIGLVATVSWRGMALVVLVYLALLLPAALYQMQGTAVTPALFAFNWWTINGPATLFVLAFLVRPIRAMGPIVAALVVASAAGVFGTAGALNETMIEWISSAAASLGFRGSFGGIAASLIVFGSAALAAALVGYIALRGLGRLYRAQWLSDQSLQLDAVWLTFAVLQSPIQLPYAGLASFLIYKLVAALGQRSLGFANAAGRSAPRLLLLRVFSLGTRSRRLFDVFARLWRYSGSVRMIAGPDLANATVEPHEFLDFLAGRLQRRFIAGPTALGRRLAETQLQRDPDGRFRVSTFFCHADTWQMVLRRLARDSDVVLMDLRGFMQANQGCVFELHELLNAVPLGNVLLVVDRTTDERFLTEVLTQGWAKIGPASPNWSDPAPLVRLYRLKFAGAQGIGGLVSALSKLHGPSPAAAGA